jgi:hypothetical protein
MAMTTSRSMSVNARREPIFVFLIPCAENSCFQSAFASSPLRLFAAINPCPSVVTLLHFLSSILALKMGVVTN